MPESVRRELQLRLRTRPRVHRKFRLLRDRGEPLATVGDTAARSIAERDDWSRRHTVLPHSDALTVVYVFDCNTGCASSQNRDVVRYDAY